MGTPATACSSGAGTYSGPMTKSPSLFEGAFFPEPVITVHFGANGPSMRRVGGGGRGVGAAVAAGAAVPAGEGDDAGVVVAAGGAVAAVCARIATEPAMAPASTARIEPRMQPPS